MVWKLLGYPPMETSPPLPASPPERGHAVPAGGLERRFALAARGTTARTEVVAGITTFLAAAYLLVVIPTLLAGAGMDRGAATTATILLFAGFTAFMGLYANLPFVVGPGIGPSVLVMTMATAEGIPWPEGLGIAFVAGLAFLALTLAGGRAIVTKLIPAQIKYGLAAAIGIFIALFGFRNAGMVAVNAKTNALALGDFTRPGALVALIGLGAAIFLRGRKVPGAILLAILAATAAGIPLHVTRWPAAPLSMPHGLGPVAFHLSLSGIFTAAAIPYFFAIFAAEFFSTLGTALAVGGKAGLLDKEGNLPNLDRPFRVDSLGGMVGPLAGVPGMTALVESAAGAEAGGRTGLTSLATAGAFLLTLFCVPVALATPKEATAPALILIGFSLFGNVRHIDFSDFSEYLPVLAMVMLTLIANSYGTGIAGGLLAYVAVKALCGRFRDLSWGLGVLALFLAYYLWTVARPH